MRLDAGSGTHPVITPIRDAFAASNAFDAITYQKGRAVVAMLEAYVGEEAFRTAIRSYIAKYAYGNTTTDQLWAELDRVSPASPEIRRRQPAARSKRFGPRNRPPAAVRRTDRHWRPHR